MQPLFKQFNMKNIYLAAALFFSLNVFSQFGLQNANWYFGQYAGLKFSLTPNGVPVVLNNSAMNTANACATVSDTRGNLLFYTNGETVWNKNHVVMANGTGLFGDDVNTQGVVIVLKPGSSTHYYIVTIDGYSGGKKGLYYSEVDMALSGGLGQIITKNVVLKDHNNVDINTAYNNQSEKLTSTIHRNGTDYWIVAHVKNYIYAYQVSQNGIALIPVGSQAQEIASGYKGTGQMKISDYYVGQSHLHLGITYPNGSGILYPYLSCGVFNNTTGIVTFPYSLLEYNDIQYNNSLYGLEFTDIHGKFTVSSAGIMRWFLMGSGTLLNYNTAWDFYLNYLGKTSMQKALNNRTYITAPNFSFLESYPTTDTTNGPVISETYLGSGLTKLGLPQWVHLNFKQCVDDWVITEPIMYGTITMQASNSITSSATEDYNSYKAGNVVVLTDGFNVPRGASFRAYIEDCNASQPIEPRPALTDETASQEEKITKANLFSLSPNPATTVFTVRSTVNVKNITVTSFDGKVMFSKGMKDKITSYTIDAGSYTQGIYSVTVLTETGETQTQKLIKN